MTDTILLTVEHGLARITLNRPERYNAIDLEMALGWQKIAFEAAERDDVRVVLIDAEGKAFCAGGDLLSIAERIDDGGRITHLAEVIHAGQAALIRSAKPVVAAVQGAVAGGGLGLFLSSDYAVASEAAVFASRYGNIGLTPDMSVTTHLGRAVGERRALQLMLQDITLTAAEALDWGLVAEVVPAEQVAQRALDVAQFWLNGSARAYGEAKRLVRTASDRRLEDNLDDEAVTIGRMLETPEAQERISAFVEQSRNRAR